MMNYVQHYEINGISTKQIACIELHGEPNAATEGAVGVLGIDVDSPTHDLYKCVAANNGIYTWESLSGGVPIIEIETPATVESTTLTDEEIAKIRALNGGSCLLKVNVEAEEGVVNTLIASPVVAPLDDGFMYCFQTAAWQVIVTIPNDATI